MSEFLGATRPPPAQLSRQAALCSAYARGRDQRFRRVQNPTVARLRVTPATRSKRKRLRKPTISWAFMLFQRTPTGLSTGLSGLFIGTYSTRAYAAYAGWRDLDRPLRCTFAAEAGAIIALHRAALRTPYAAALLNPPARFAVSVTPDAPPPL